MKVTNEIDKRIGLSVGRWSPRTYVETFHWHTELEIGYCYAGKGRFYFGDKAFDAEPGDVFVVNNLERHIAQSDERDPSRYYFVYFDSGLLLKEEKELLHPFLYHPAAFTNRIPGSHEAAAEIGQLVEKLWREQEAKETGYPSAMKGVLLQICALLCRYYGDGIRKRDGRRAYLLYEKMQPVLSLMKARFREDLQLEDIAALMRLSPSRAAHVFAETVGEGFKAHLLQLRVNEAKRLLAETELAVIEVCLRSGFQSTTPFYRAFRQIVGLTPQEYRDMTASISSAHLERRHTAIE